MRRLTQLAILCLAGGSCTGAVLAPSQEGRSIERDNGAPVQTDSLVYHFTAQGEAFSVVIPFRYDNDTGRTISIVNCRGGLNISLEKRGANGWQPFYSPVLLMCLSPPITVAPGAAYTNTVRIHGHVPGRNVYPAFASAELDGEYRLVWGGLVHGYDDRRQGFGDPVGPLRSNSFLLVAPDD